ncbi:alcohol dehydrogenase cytochrome c subunit [Caballeronia temeraria]|uniref:Alcohol dehydrogenase cytochrome c subunit n=2 Tax=Caballeronia temeraria TaxID=1777137 RepID=A0A158B9D8_9BURK|nr:alcohol dehydrogenase cytochrome c subunit [Caballeronia temeraria]
MIVTTLRRRVLCLAFASIATMPFVHAQTSDLVTRGAYLAKAADCAGCHTAPPAPGKPQPHPFAGGLPMGSPFGTIWSSNITPDPQHGIGRYSYEDFARALREGVAPGGKHLYPAMPYPSFSKIDDDDMRALYAYFMHGVEPVAQAAPETHLPFPFSQRWALAFWNFAFAPSKPFTPDPKRDAQWNRGAYLVQSLGHCGACHTPRGPAYNERGFTESSRAYLTGGTNDHWYAPNLTGAQGAGLGRLSPGDIAAFLKTGHGAGLATFGSMVQVVEDSTQYLDDQDLLAIASYLKSLPASENGGAYDAHSRLAQQSVAALHTGDDERPGAGLYQSACARCHKSNGEGEELKFPRLAGNPAVLSEKPDSLVRMVLQGGRPPSTEHGPQPKKMPPFADKLTDTEVARVLTFVRSAWGNDASPVTTRDVKIMRDAVSKNTSP